ncbi:MAG: hypothetical protein LBS04_00130 [Tannerellaceae bacterium]|jgi:hypothetical protein|nr:hypothetical protein [Tannerellaceae bacterium]
MKKNTNRDIVDAIIDRIPPNIKPVVYLMDKLDINKDSAYRRIKGNIPFTFSELAKLSAELDFSLDNIIKNDGRAACKNTEVKFNLSSAEDFIVERLDVYYHLKKTYLKDIQAYRSIVSLNKYHIFFILKYDNLFKFYYYSWIYQMSDLPIHFSFSDLQIPERITAIRKKLISVAFEYNHSDLILDPNFFLNLIRDIQYYYKRGLISTDELALFKDELYDLIAHLEPVFRKGRNDADSNTYSYLSSISIDTNIIQMSYKDAITTMIWYNPVYPAFEYETHENIIYRKWLESLKKFSVLITRSNYGLTANFIKKQQMFIHNLENYCDKYETDGPSHIEF